MLAVSLALTYNLEHCYMWSAVLLACGWKWTVRWQIAKWWTSAAAWQLPWPELLWRCSSLCTICRIDRFILFYSQRWQHCGYCTSLTHSHLGPILSEYTISLKDSSQKNHLDMDHVMVNYSCHTPRCHTHHRLPHISGCSPLIRAESGIERSDRN